MLRFIKTCTAVIAAINGLGFKHVNRIIYWNSLILTKLKLQKAGLSIHWFNSYYMLFYISWSYLAYLIFKKKVLEWNNVILCSRQTSLNHIKGIRCWMVEEFEMPRKKKTTQMSLNYIKGISCGLVEEFEMSRKETLTFKGNWQTWNLLKWYLNIGVVRYCEI